VVSAIGSCFGGALSNVNDPIHHWNTLFLVPFDSDGLHISPCKIQMRVIHPSFEKRWNSLGLETKMFKKDNFVQTPPRAPLILGKGAD
jgi:hypothetical protein